MFVFFFFLESILSKLQKIPGLYVHSCNSVFGFFQCVIFLFYLFVIFYLIFKLVFCLQNQLCYIFAYTVLQSWRVKMWRIFSQLSLVPAPTNHLHHHRCLTPRVQGPFPPHLALECLITTQVPLYTLLFLRDGTFFCVCGLFQNMYFFNCVKETPCFRGCR